MNLNNLSLTALLNQLKNKNLQAYNAITQAMQSGKDPTQILNNLISSGQFSQQQVEQAKQIMNNNNSNNQNRKTF